MKELPKTIRDVGGSAQDQKSKWIFRSYVIAFTVFIWTTYTILLRDTRTRLPPSQLYYSTTVVFLAEATKFGLALLLLWRSNKFDSTATKNEIIEEFLKKPREIIKLSVPSIVYAIQNNLDFVALSNLEPGVYQVTTQLKVVTTALFMVVMLGKRYSARRWVAILALFGGVALVQLDAIQNENSVDTTSTSKLPQPTSSTSKNEQNYYVGIVAVLTTCMTAGFAGVYFEMVLKDGSSTSFWIRNLQLYVSGIVSAGIGCIIKDGYYIGKNGFFHGYSFRVVIIVCSANPVLFSPIYICWTLPAFCPDNLRTPYRTPKVSPRKRRFMSTMSLLKDAVHAKSANRARTTGKKTHMRMVMPPEVPFCLKPDDSDRSKKWYMSAEEYQKIPSLRSGLRAQDELKNRQRASDFIITMGEKLNHNIRDQRARITNLCICAAMVHMHRFFVFHPFQIFDPRKFQEAAQFLVTLENILLQTIAFDLEVQMPHTDIIKGSQRIMGKEMTEVAYWMASDILSMTNYCVRYRPSVLACVAIHMTGIWRKWEPPTLPNGEPWFKAFDKEATPELLKELSTQLMAIMAEVKSSGGEGGRPRVQSHLLKLKQKAEAQRAESAGSGPTSDAASASGRLQPPPPPPNLNSSAAASNIPSSNHSGAGSNNNNNNNNQLQNSEASASNPSSSSPIKRVKTEPTVLNIDKYKERKAAAQAGPGGKPDAAKTVGTAAPAGPKKSFMPDTSATNLFQLDTTSGSNPPSEPFAGDQSRRQKERPPGASAHFNSGSGRNAERSDRKRPPHPEWNSADGKARKLAPDVLHRLAPENSKEAGRTDSSGRSNHSGSVPPSSKHRQDRHQPTRPTENTTDQQLKNSSSHPKLATFSIGDSKPSSRHSSPRNQQQQHPTNNSSKIPTGSSAVPHPPYPTSSNESNEGRNGSGANHHQGKIPSSSSSKHHKSDRHKSSSSTSYPDLSGHKELEARNASRPPTSSGSPHNHQQKPHISSSAAAPIPHPVKQTRPVNPSSHHSSRPPHKSASSSGGLNGMTFLPPPPPPPQLSTEEEMDLEEGEIDEDGPPLPPDDGPPPPPPPFLPTP